jgi:hypothetical protein
VTAHPDTDHERAATAYHEAGHAAVAVWFGLQLERVELTPDHPIHAGYCQERVDDPEALSLAIELGEEAVIRPQIQILLAGGVAQHKGGLGHVPGSDHHDLEVALKMATRMVGCASGAEALLEHSRAETRKLLDRAAVWAGVEALAGELLEKGRVVGDDAHRILASASTYPLPERNSSCDL